MAKFFSVRTLLAGVVYQNVYNPLLWLLQSCSKFPGARTAPTSFPLGLVTLTILRCRHAPQLIPNDLGRWCVLWVLS